VLCLLSVQERSYDSAQYCLHWTSAFGEWIICNVLTSALCNPLNPELNPICYLPALLAHHFLHFSRIMVKSLPLRLLMSYIYIYIYIYIYDISSLRVKLQGREMWLMQEWEAPFWPAWHKKSSFWHFVLYTGLSN